MLFLVRGGPLEITGGVGGKNFSMDEFFLVQSVSACIFFFHVEALHDFFVIP